MDKISNTYGKFVAAILCVVSVIGLALGINHLTKKDNIAVIGGADGPTALYFESDKPKLQSIIKLISSAALLIAAIGTLLLTFVKLLSRKESE